MTVDDRLHVPNRGRLKIFLGAAAGVGKAYAMLGEARDNLEEG
jgi:K+-sensing histidine kinase KdpD